MTLRSLLPLFAFIALSSCTINGGDGDDDGDDVSDSGDDGGDPSGDDADDGDGSSDSGDDGGDDQPSDGDDPGDEGDQGDDSSDGSGAVDPRSGVWDYTEYTPISNDCDIPDDYGNAGGGFGLVANGDGFTVGPNDGTDPFDCELDGADFVCPDRATERAEIDPSYDAVLVGQASAEGTFSDDENASGRQTAVIDCEGADCSLLEQVTGADFPCNFEVDFVIDWRTGA
jgi:hypothetical protein